VDEVSATVEVLRAVAVNPALVAHLLTHSERARHSALTDSGSRARVATGRALLRTAAARRFGVPPTEVALDYRCVVCGGPHGKPELRTTNASLHASVSYSGTVVLVAVADVPVGVDVEQCSATAFAGFESIALSALERADSAPMAPERRAELWVRKEAVLKISGVGLSVAPETVHIGRAASGRVQVPESVVAAGWASTVGVAVPAGYRAAVAVGGRQKPRVIVRDGRALLAAAAAAVHTATV
jgi:4'-phosphopantetheinyl transferase